MTHSTNSIAQDNSPEARESLRRQGAEQVWRGVTILEAVASGIGGAPLLTKAITPGPNGRPVIGDYDGAMWFVFHIRECADIKAWARLLARLEKLPHCAIVPGAPVDGLDLTRPQRRLLHRQADGAQPTLRDIERDWIAFDVDGAADVPGKGWRTHPREALAAAWERDAPEWCRGVDFVAYFTSGQGFKPGLRYRVLLLLTRPLSSAAAKACIKAENERRRRDGRGSALFDAALYSAVEPHYTAAPVFGEGIVDPLPGGRVFLIEGTGRRATPPDEAVERVYSGVGMHGGGRVGAGTGSSKQSAMLPRVMTKAESLARGGPDSAYSPTINRILYASEIGVDAFHGALICAATTWVIENGPWADPVPILKRAWSVLSRHAQHREPGYIERQWIGVADWTEQLQARDRRRAESIEGHGTADGKSSCNGGGGARAATGDVIRNTPTMEGRGS